MSKELELRPDATKVDGSLQGRLRARLMSNPQFVSQGVLNASECLLLDVSGSMWGEPIRKLRSAVRDFKLVRRFEYADVEDFHELGPNEECREPGGNNHEHLVFPLLREKGIRHVVLVTDGGADRPDEALRAARGLKIDIIYIGPPPRPKFLDDLARQTGGSFDAIQFAQTDGAKLLTGKIKGLLTAPSTGKEPIRL